MTVLITLTTIGTDCSLFDIYSNTDGFVSAFETDVPKASLSSGFSSANVPDGTTVIRVKAKGVCTNYIDINLSNVTTTTTTSSSSTTTTTTTTAPNGFFSVAVVIPNNQSNPTDAGESSICYTGNKWTKSVNLDTTSPQVGSKIYLTDKTTPAIPGNLSSFGADFNQYGIRWIRFSLINNNIYDVNPSTGVIIGISTNFTC